MLEINARDLHRILSTATYFAHQDGTLPSINAVLLEYDGDNLTALATDRFKMCASRLSLSRGETQAETEAPASEQPEQPWTITIPLAQVKVVLPHLKTDKHMAALRTVKLDVGTSGATFDLGGPATTADVTVAVKRLDMPFPAWRSLMKPTDDQTQVGHITLAPRHLAPFIRVAKQTGNGQIRFAFRGYEKPVIVRIGDDFVGLIMPIRLPDGGVDLTHPAWLRALLDQGGAK